MDKQMTAVNYLIESIEEQVIRVDHANSRIHISISFEDFMYMKKQAKQMEREQIEQSGWVKCSDRLPTKDDADEDDCVWVWDAIDNRPMTEVFYTDWGKHCTHWRKIVKPENV